MKEKKALVIIDAQNDFLDGGKLGVEGSRKKMLALADFIRYNTSKYDFMIASVDFHPLTHCSFVKNGGIWPVHCVQHSEGAAIFEPILRAIEETGAELHVLTKGVDEDHEEYSVLKNKESKKALSALINAHEITEADFCGIADVYCVKDSITDFHREFPNVKVGVYPEFVGNMDEKGFRDFLWKSEYIETKENFIEK
jgi:nicotinamidase/pyrazinamidase